MNTPWIIFILSIASPCLPGVCIEGVELPRHLAQLCAYSGGSSRAPEAEAKALAFLTASSSLEECGMTYGAICLIYGGTSFSDKVLEYGGMALAFPLTESLARAIRLRIVWAKARKMRDLSGPALYGAKREMIMLCVAGAALAAKNLDTLSEVPFPRVVAYDVNGPPDDPQVKAIIDRHHREVAAWKAARIHNLLFEQFDAFIRFCAVAFKESGVTEDELKVVAAKAGCSEKVVEYLMRKVAGEKEKK